MDFEQFYITWYSRVKNFANEYVLRDEDAENITQDVFVDLYLKEIILNSQINQVAYLFTSVKNKCIDHLRRRLIEKEAAENIQKDFTLKLQMKFDSLETFDIDYDSEQKIEELIEHAINLLPERCRVIFMKSQLERKKQKVIAEELGISVKTVENQITTAYKKLREELKDYMPLLLFLFIN